MYSFDGSPTTPVPVKVVTGENSLVIQNENLFDKDNANLVQKGIISSQGILTDDNDTRLENDNLIFFYLKNHNFF